jgi:hypothetical protein
MNIAGGSLSPIQQKQKTFMKTFSRVLGDSEENRLYEQAFDTYAEQSLPGGGSFKKEVPKLLAAHTFNEAKSSLSEAMPDADIGEIRQAAEQRPEIAKWVSLLDTSSQFLADAVAEARPAQVSVTRVPATQDPVWSMNVPRSVPSAQSAPTTLFMEAPAEVADAPVDTSEARSLVQEAASYSQRAGSEYESAASHAESSSDDMHYGASGGGFLGDSRDGMKDLLSSAQSAKGTSQAAGSAGEAGVDRSAETERLLSEAQSVLSDHPAADKIARLMALCDKARHKGAEGLSELTDAETELGRAVDEAQNIVESPEEAQMGMNAIDARHDAGESGSAFRGTAYDFQDAASTQEQVTAGLREILSTL